MTVLQRNQRAAEVRTHAQAPSIRTPQHRARALQCCKGRAARRKTALAAAAGIALAGVPATRCCGARALRWLGSHRAKPSPALRVMQQNARRVITEDIDVPRSIGVQGQPQARQIATGHFAVHVARQNKFSHCLSAYNSICRCKLAQLQYMLFVAVFGTASYLCPALGYAW
jgi:hypothetical protein